MHEECESLPCLITCNIIPRLWWRIEKPLANSNILGSKPNLVDYIYFLSYTAEVIVLYPSIEFLQVWVLYVITLRFVELIKWEENNEDVILYLRLKKWSNALLSVLAQSFSILKSKTSFVSLRWPRRLSSFAGSEYWIVYSFQHCWDFLSPCEGFRLGLKIKLL